jgi:hypothetical protein
MMVPLKTDSARHPGTKQTKRKGSKTKNRDFQKEGKQHGEKSLTL